MKKTALIAYVPALHRGYMDFFAPYTGSDCYLLSEDFIKILPYLERDVRALTPDEAKLLIESLNIFSSVQVLTSDSLNLIHEADRIVMPDEDISHEFAKKHLPEKTVDYVSRFLRWDKMKITNEFTVPSDRIISESELDRELMDRADREATLSPDWWRQIGALIVKDGQIIVQTHNRAMPSDDVMDVFGDPRSNFDVGDPAAREIYKTVHAEAGAIAEAAKKGIPLEDASLYVSTFPCPTCAKSAVLAGIKKIYYRKGYSILDAEDILRKFGVKITLVK